jgi:Rrf2 family protein
MLSSTSDYALRALLVLAQADHGRPMRAEEVARATGSPANYLAKTLNALAKAGIVASARGPLGGFTLLVPADELSIARIVDCFDEARPSTRCLLGNRPCDGRHPCRAHARWTAVQEARRAPLARTTVADLLAGSSDETSDVPSRIEPFITARREAFDPDAFVAAD